MTTRIKTLTQSFASERVFAASSERVFAASFAIILGSLFLFGTGFAQSSHNVAHDTRHSIAFPCH